MKKLKSRKFLVTVGVGLLTALNDALSWGLSPEALTKIASIAAAYILGQGYVDGKEKESSK